jgi:hypothetical protein
VSTAIRAISALTPAPKSLVAGIAIGSTIVC